jgi:Domain of unknown function (DUF222)/HNH endonuclease
MAIAPDSTSSPAEVLAAAREALGVLEDRLTAGFTDEELVAGVEAAQVLKSATAAVEARLVAEADARDLAKKRLHWGSTADWVTHCAGVHRREGRRIVAHARQLMAEQTETLQAMRRGQTSPAQAAVICTAVDDFPASLELRRRAEAFLLEQCRTLTATELARAARHLINVVDPDRAERNLEAALDREERAAHRDRFLSITDDGAGGVRIKGRCSVEDGETLRAALLPLTKPAPAVDPDDPTCTPDRDPRDHGARTLDALVQIAQHALDTDLPPTSHGARPRVGVLVAFEDIKDGYGAACGTDTGLEVDPATIRRWACDADLIPACLGSTGEVLDLGRTVRLVTHALWLALVLRDRHCAFAGCTRPPVMCQAHHIVHWADGGPTSLENLVLVCGEHHRTLHHSPWRVRINTDDGKPEFLPPPRRHDPDPPPEWIRHRPRRQ